MKYLVVFAHPYSKSFNNAIVDTIKEEVINNGVEIEIRDLYDIGFANGFAFIDGENGPTGLLNGKKALLISTTGFPSDIYEEIGMQNI